MAVGTLLRTCAGSHRRRNVGNESGNRLAFRTLTIGRRRDADIRLTDRSVSRVHAEVTMTGDGRYFLIDCGSLRGTWTKAGSGEWVRHRQGYVEAVSRVRFGRCETRLGKLAPQAPGTHEVADKALEVEAILAPPAARMEG